MTSPSFLADSSLMTLPHLQSTLLSLCPLRVCVLVFTSRVGQVPFKASPSAPHRAEGRYVRFISSGVPDALWGFRCHR